VSVFCRHNRYTAECPICSKGTVLDPAAGASRRRSTAPGGAKPRRAAREAAGRRVVGKHAAAGPYEDGDGRYEVRLERVPGGLRLAAWSGGELRRAAPVLDAADLAPLLGEAAAGVVAERDAAALAEAAAVAPHGRERPGETAMGGVPGRSAGEGFGASAGRSGELRDELRVERLDDGRLRIARWINRPNRGWELQEAPVMLPAARFAEAIAGAARGGLLSGSGAGNDPYE
jgi:hypothetical protein